MVDYSLMNNPPLTPCHTSTLIIEGNEHYINLVLFDCELPWNLLLFSLLNKHSSTNNFLCQLFTKKMLALPYYSLMNNYLQNFFFHNGHVTCSNWCQTCPLSNLKFRKFEKNDFLKMSTKIKIKILVVGLDWLKPYF